MEGQIRGKDVINDDVFEQLSKLDASLAKILESMSKIQSAGVRSNTNTSLAGVSEKSVNLTKQANDLLKEQARLEKELQTQQRAASQAQKERESQVKRESDLRERLARQRVAEERAAKREEAQLKRLSAPYNKLLADLQKAENQYRDLAAAEGINNTATIQARKVVTDLRNQVDGINEPIKRFNNNVGNYRSAVQGVVGVTRQLFGAFGAIEAGRFLINFTRDSIAAAREAKGVEFAFNRIRDSAKILADTRAATNGFISDVEIQRSTVQLNNFGLSTENVATLLQFASVRAAQTGDNVEKLVDQITLGLGRESVQRLDDLGVTQAKLNEEIAKGKTFVEAFTDIAKREIPKAGDVLGEAGNESERFNAQLSNLSVAFGKLFTQVGGLSTFTDLLTRYRTGVELSTEALKESRNPLNVLTIGLRDATEAGRAENVRLLDEIKNRKLLTDQIKKQTDEYVALNGSLAPLREGQQEANPDPFSLVPNIRLLSDINADLEKQRQLLDAGNFSTNKQAEAIKAKIKVLEAERDAILGTTSAEKEKQKTLEGTIAFFQETISKQKELQSQTAKNSEEFNKFQRSIQEAEGAILNIQGAFDNNDPVIIPVKFDLSEIDGEIDLFGEDAATLQSVDDFLNTQGIQEGMEGLARNLKKPIEELFADFNKFYENDFKSFLDFQKKKVEAEIEANDRRLEVQTEVANIVNDLGQSLFVIGEERAVREIERQNEILDATINGKDATEEQIRIAEEKKLQNEKRLQKERDKAQKKSFILEQVTNVAKIFMADALARANALASSLLLPPIAAQAYLATQQGIISTNTGLSLAAVLAQTLPAFFMGKDEKNSFEGIATWGEKRREVKIGKDGNVEVSPNRTTPIYIKKDDIILKSLPDFHSSMKNPNSEAFKRINGDIARETEYRVNGYPHQVERAIKKGFKGIKHNITVINRVEQTSRSY